MSLTLKIDGGYNIRDLGDLPTVSGQRTLRRVLLRSGNLDCVSAVGQQQLLDYGVKTVIDLRDEWEVERYPTPFSRSTVVRYLNLPLVGARLSNDAAFEASTQNDSLEDLYVRYLDRCQPQIGAIIAAVAASAGATLFHCYAGKDRTGIVSALLLGAVGVLDHFIVEDYAQSSEHITHLAQTWRAHAAANGHDLEQLERDIASNPETMRAMLDTVKRRDGGTANYLKTCGVRAQQLKALRARFVGE